MGPFSTLATATLAWDPSGVLASARFGQLMAIGLGLLLSAAVVTAHRRSRQLEALRLSHEALKKTEERYRLASYATNDAIWDLDMGSREVWVNEAHQSRYGDPPDVEISQSFFGSRVHPDDAARVEAGFRASVKSAASIWSAEFRYWQFDGTYANVIDCGYLIRNSQGRVVRIVGALLNVTALKKAEEAVDRLRRQNESILNSAGEGIIGIDTEGQATFVNAAAARLTGWPVNELIGRPILHLVHSENADGTEHSLDLCPAQRTLRQGTAEACDVEVFRRRDGSYFPVDFISSPVLDEEGRLAGAVLAFRDITERRAIERMKSEFVATVSHELRTPLTSIRGALGLLGSGLLGEVDVRGRRMLDIAVMNTDRLSRLLNDILDIERLQSSACVITTTRCDTAELIVQAVEVMRPMAEKNGVDLHATPALATIVADPDRVLQTLVNLLSNAIKFSPAGTVVRISAEEQGRSLCIKVEDQGRGIPEEHLESIFDRFHQVDASDSRDKGGTGLGLSICRVIARQHGGRIWVESRLGEGSTFFLTLPLAAAVEETSPLAIPPHSGQASELVVHP